MNYNMAQIQKLVGPTLVRDGDFARQMAIQRVSRYAPELRSSIIRQPAHIVVEYCGKGGRV